MTRQYVRFQSLAGGDFDTTVLRDPDTGGPDDLLCEMYGPAHPDDQRNPRHRPHAKNRAGDPWAIGEELVSLPYPADDNTVEWIDESDLWVGGRFVLEREQPLRYEALEWPDGGLVRNGATERKARAAIRQIEWESEGAEDAMEADQ